MRKTNQILEHVHSLEHALEQRNAELALFSSIQEALLSCPFLLPVIGFVR